MATPTIPNGEEYFFPIIYEGNGGGQRVGKFVPFTNNGTIANSCVFEGGSTEYLTRTAGASPTSERLFTISFWVKFSKLGTKQTLLGLAEVSGSTQRPVINYEATGKLTFVTSGGTKINRTTDRTFEDTSKWYHFLAKVNVDEGTPADRVKIYVDGEEQSLTGQTLTNSDPFDLASQTQNIGRLSGTTQLFTGYLAEINYVDGTALGPDTFGVTDTSTGRWIPKTLSGITYGTNGFRLAFGTGSAMGDDTANSNDFTENNIDATNQTTDSPTQNFATFDPNDDTGTMPLSEGNREVTQSGSSSGAIRGTLAPSSGKYYFEFKAISVAASDGFGGVGIQLKNEPVDAATSVATIGANTYIYRDDGFMVHNGVGTSGFTNYGSGAIIGVALDLDNGKLYFSYSSGAGTDGVYENSGDPVAGTGAVYTLPSNQRYAPYLVFKGSSGQNYSLNTGQTSFNTAPPTGFVALQQDNLPETAKGISGLVWMKNRDAADSHQLYDSSRGKQLVIQPDVNTAQQTVTNGLQKFLVGGQQIEGNDAINTSGESFVSWNWVGNGGSTSSNTDGSIISTVQVNQTAGFSIIQFEGTLTASQSVGHGLSQAPEWVVCKPLDISSGGWAVYHTALSSASQTLFLDTNGKEASSSTMWQGLAPDSTVINVGANSSSNRNSSMVHYAWHSVDGFSKFGKYTGNGSANGPFIYTGFLPSFVLVKLVSGATTGNWTLYDSARSPINPITNYLLPDRELVEASNTNREIDFLSNGFKFYGNNANVNTINYIYLYCAFAKNPFVGDGTSPVTAR